jgi:hypothetical protein
MATQQRMTPTRLTFSDGTWRLELEELVSMSTCHFRPVSYFIEGADNILISLQTTPVPDGMYSDTQRILDSPVKQSSMLAYHAGPTGWVVARPDAEVISQPTDNNQVDVSRFRLRLRNIEQGLRQLNAIESRLSRLEVLEQRVTTIEKRERQILQAATTQQATQSNARPTGDHETPVHSQATMKAETQVAKDQEKASGDMPVPGSKPRKATGKPEPTQAGDSQGKPVTSTEAKQKAKAMKWPPLKAIDQALHMLLGNKITLVEVQPSDYSKIDDDEGSYYIGDLLNDADEVIGALIADLSATVHLGGGLMMIPQAVREEEIEKGMPSEEEIDALSEIFNNACSLINKVSANPHARASAAKALDLSASPWIQQATNRREIEADFGGRIIFLAK